MQKQLLELDWEWWETIVDFEEGVSPKEILLFLESGK